jgi:translation initiation factor 2-alpha kinase 1
LYDKSPHQNRALFLAICSKLSDMGIIDSEDFVDELSSIRGTYKLAFKQLVIEALRSFKVNDGHFDSSEKHV